MVSGGSLTHIWFILFLVKTTHGVTLDITLTGDPLTGTVITLTCNIPSFNQAASWKNSALSSGVIQSCTAGFCLATNPSYPGYTFTTNSSAYTVEIASADLDDNIWTCEHNTTVDSGAITLNLKVAPTTCTLAKSGDTYTCTSSCGYPAGDMSIRAKLNGTSKTQDLTSLTAVSTPACTSPQSAYSANVPTSFFTQNADLYCECGVSGIESTFVQSNALPVTASRVCDDCEKPVIPLGIVGLIFVLIAAVICWLLYCQLSRKWSGPLTECAQDGDIEFTTKKLFWSTVIATVLCLLGFFLCLPGVIICGMCEEGVTTSGKVTTALILVIIGFALALIIMIVEIILLVLVCCRKIKIKDSTCQRATPDGQEGQPPTTTESNIRTETSPRPLRDASNDSPRGKLAGVPANRQLPPLATTDQVDARQKANQLAGVPANRQLPPLDMTDQVDARQKANQLEPLEYTETKKLKKKKKRRSKEEKEQADDEN